MFQTNYFETQTSLSLCEVFEPTIPRTGDEYYNTVIPKTINLNTILINVNENEMINVNFDEMSLVIYRF